MKMTNEQIIIKTMHEDKELFERVMEKYSEILSWQEDFLGEDFRELQRFPLGDYDLVLDIINSLKNN